MAPYNKETPQARAQSPRKRQIQVLATILPPDSKSEYTACSVGTDLVAHFTIIAPPCKCSECNQQWRSIKEQHRLGMRYNMKFSQHEAEMELKKLLANTERHLLYLRNQCGIHGNLIMSRWKNLKSIGKRQRMLLAVDPDMYPHPQLLHHMMTYGYKGSSLWPNLRDRHDSYLLPYINIPNLRDDPSKFLSLLLNRTRFSPEQWAPYDNSELRLGWHHESFNVDFFLGSIIMHGSKYGHLIEWDKPSAETWTTVGFPRGKLILEAQECIVAFLSKMVVQLLEGIDDSTNLGSDKWNEFAVNGSMSSGVHWSTSLNQAFSPPPTFDIDHILSLAQTRLNSASDHLEFLQTDPRYMRREIGLIRQGYDKIFSSVVGDQYRHTVARVQDDFDDFLGWEWVRDECLHAKNTITKFSDTVGPSTALPSEVDRALGALDILVANRLHTALEGLNTRCLEDVEFRKSWTIANVERGNTSQIVFESAEALTELEFFEKDSLHWALQHLYDTDPESPDVFEHNIAYSMINDYLAKGSSADRGRINSRILKSLTKCAAYQEMLSAIRLHRPTSRNCSIHDIFETEDRRSWRWLKKSCEIQKDPSLFPERVPSKAFPRRLAELASLIKDFEAAPLPVVGRPNQTWLDSFSNSQAILSDFWAAIRELRRKDRMRFNQSQDDITSDLKILMADTELALNVQAFTQEKARLIARIAAAGSSAPLISAGHTQMEWDHDEVGSAKTVIRNKKKTRPVDFQLPFANAATETEANDDTSDSEVEETPPLPKLAIRRQSFNIFTAMFNIEGRKLYNWDAFVALMYEAGFPASHTGNGSAVSFKADKTRCSWSGRIVFDKPHSVEKIDSITLFVWGKRMTKWFGWSGDTFVEKK